MEEYKVLKIIQTHYCIYGFLISCKKKQVKYTSFSTTNKLGRSIRGFKRLNTHSIFMHKFDANTRINFYSYIPKSERRNKFDILVLVEKLMNMMMEFYYSLDKSPS